MFWVTLTLLLASLFIFLWHPSLKKSLSMVKKIRFIGGTTLLALCLYIYKGSPNLPDHPFFYIEKMSASPEKLSHRAEIPSLIQRTREHPRDPQNWAILGDRYHEEKHYYESALHYREAWRLDPQNNQYKNLYAQTLLILYHGKSNPTAQRLLRELTPGK